MRGKYRQKGHCGTSIVLPTSFCQCKLYKWWLMHDLANCGKVVINKTAFEGLSVLIHSLCWGLPNTVGVGEHGWCFLCSFVGCYGL